MSEMGWGGGPGTFLVRGKVKVPPILQRNMISVHVGLTGTAHPKPVKKRKIIDTQDHKKQIIQAPASSAKFKGLGIID